MDCPRLMTFGLAQTTRVVEGRDARREAEEDYELSTLPCVTHVTPFDCSVVPRLGLLLHLADSRTCRVPSVRRCNQHLVLVTPLTVTE